MSSAPMDHPCLCSSQQQSSMMSAKHTKHHFVHFVEVFKFCSMVSANPVQHHFVHLAKLLLISPALLFSQFPSLFGSMGST